MKRFFLFIIVMSLLGACEKKTTIKKQVKFIVKLKNESYFSEKINLSNSPFDKLDASYFELQESYFKFSKKKKTEIPFDVILTINTLLSKYVFSIYPIFSKPNVYSIYSSIPENSIQCYAPNLATYFIVTLELNAPESEITPRVKDFINILNRYFTDGFLDYSYVRDDIVVNTSTIASVADACETIARYPEVLTYSDDNRMKFQPYLRDLKINFLWDYAANRPIKSTIPRNTKINMIGQGINFVDIEGGWEIRNSNYFNKDYQLKGQVNDYFINHGTNTVGLVSSHIAPNSDAECGSVEMRISGFAPMNNTWLVSLFQSSESLVNVSTEQREWSVLLGMIVALTAENHSNNYRFHNGTVMLLEWSHNDGQEKPFENERVIHDLIKMATHCLDFTVVEGAADNAKGVNLDSVGSNFFNTDAVGFDDSGAIIVGSTMYLDPVSEPNFKRESSNYGKRVNSFIFGQNILTTSSNNVYDFFANTSASAAIIAGIATSLQWYSQEKWGRKLPSAKMREFLTNNNPSIDDTAETFIMPNFECLMYKVDCYFNSTTAGTPPADCACN